MFNINLQLLGGRGGGSSGKSKGDAVPFKKFTSKQVNSMNRSQLLTLAKAVFINKNTANGMSASTAARRFDLLAGSNSVAQLKKYINKNQ